MSPRQDEAEDSTQEQKETWRKDRRERRKDFDRGQEGEMAEGEGEMEEGFDRGEAGEIEEGDEGYVWPQAHWQHLIFCKSTRHARLEEDLQPTKKMIPQDILVTEEILTHLFFDDDVVFVVVTKTATKTAKTATKTPNTAMHKS